MIGLRVGPRVGSRAGVAAGLGEDPIAVAASSSTTMTANLADSADPTPAGANFDLTLDVTNTGSVAATNVSAVITLDSSLTYVSSSGSGWSITPVGQVVTCTRATMAAGAAPTITVTVTAGNSTVSASSSAAVTADNAVEADDSESTSVVRPTQSVVIADSADPVSAGANYNYTVTVTNNGTGTINSSSVAITLDGTLTYVSSSGSGWATSQNAGVVTCTRATMAQGAAPAITITVTAGSSTHTNTTSVIASAANAANATGSENTQVNKPVLALAITDSADPVASAASYSYSAILTVTVADASSASVVITIPSDASYVSSSGTGWSLVNNSGVVTCTRASAAVGAQPTITINVTAPPAANGSELVTCSGTADATACTQATGNQTTQINAPIPTYFGAGTAVGSINAITPGFPASTLAGDIALLLVETDGPDGAATLTTANGFAACGSSPQVSNTASLPSVLTMFWKRLTGSDSAPVVADSGNHTGGQIHVFRGCTPSGDPQHVTSGSALSVASTTVSIPGVTTTVANCLIVYVTSNGRDIDATNGYSGWANASLAGVTEFADYLHSQGNGGGFGAAYGGLAVAGPSGTMTGTNVGVATGQGMICIALKP